MNAQAQRKAAIFDSYVGLRRFGHTNIDAIRTLRVLGVSFAEAKTAADLYAVEEEEPVALSCDKCGETSTDVVNVAIQTARQTHSSPAEWEEQAWCQTCRDRADYEAENGDYERARATGWAD